MRQTILWMREEGGGKTVIVKSLPERVLSQLNMEELTSQIIISPHHQYNQQVS